MFGSITIFSSQSDHERKLDCAHTRCHGDKMFSSDTAKMMLSISSPVLFKGAKKILN
jgi:hypothetical protein